MASNGLITDLYQLTMANALFKKGMHERKVVFDRFYRKNPFDGGYTVVAGIQHLVDFVKNFRYDAEDIEYLRSLGIFYPEFLDYLKDFRFHGDIYAMPEGTVAFPGEILLRFHGTTTEAMLIETGLSMIMNHESLIATKARRVRTVAPKDALMEFGLRRAQGPDAGLYGARAAMIGGCVGTSNVLAGQMFDVPVMGTHAHSWIMSFPDEYTAFKTYAEMYPDNCTLLVDTYDTLKSGVPNAIRVFQEFKVAGKPLIKYGIRLDSGDLAYLSKEARKMLDEAGFPEATICASNDLDEFLLHDLKMQGAAIDSWGVGTNLITSKDCPSFGGVYKLAAIQNEKGEFVPKIKISENTEKITNPGNKTIYRIYEKASGKIKADLICFADEVIDPKQDLLLFDPMDTWKKTKLAGGTYTVREILLPIFKNGECLYKSPTLKEIAAYCREEKDTLWDETKRLFYPHRVYVDLSQKLYAVKQSLLDQMTMTD